VVGSGGGLATKHREIVVPRKPVGQRWYYDPVPALITQVQCTKEINKESVSLLAAQLSAATDGEPISGELSIPIGEAINGELLPFSKMEAINGEFPFSAKLSITDFSPVILTNR
jgi:hypothetical protein